MTIFKTISDRMLLVMLLLCVPAMGEAACDQQDEDRWKAMRDGLPTASAEHLELYREQLTKLNGKCDPKTRFSASVVQLLFKVSFELDAMNRIKQVQSQQSRAYDPGGLPCRTGPSCN